MRRAPVQTSSYSCMLHVGSKRMGWQPLNVHGSPVSASRWVEAGLIGFVFWNLYIILIFRQPGNNLQFVCTATKIQHFRNIGCAGRLWCWSSHSEHALIGVCWTKSPKSNQPFPFYIPFLSSVTNNANCWFFLSFFYFVECLKVV